jgi:uroporphyrinogen-III synthase
MSKNHKGKIIAITRPIERSQSAVNIVEELGGGSFIVPTLELKLTCTPSLMELCQNIKKLEWLIFTSPTAVESIFKFCPHLLQKLNPICKIAVIGPKTRDFVESKGLSVEIMPSEYTAEGLLDSFLPYDLKGKYIGIPRTMAARKVLPNELKKRGAHVFVAEAYESIIPTETSSIQDLIKKIMNMQIAAVTFTSPLTVHNLFKIASNDDQSEIIKIFSQNDVLVAAIGPITGNALIEYGIDAIIPEKYTVKDMMQKLFEYL